MCHQDEARKLLILELLFSLSRFIIHPEYDDYTLEYDFALVKLAQPINFLAYPNIRPACWPTLDPPVGSEARKIRFIFQTPS